MEGLTRVRSAKALLVLTIALSSTARLVKAASTAGDRLSQAESRAGKALGIDMGELLPMRQSATGTAYFDLGRYLLSEDLAHGISINPSHLWAQDLRGYTTPELDGISKILASAASKSNKADAAFARSWCYHRVGQNKKAVAESEQAVQLSSHSLEARLLEADCWYSLKERAKALNAVDQAIKLAPKDSRCWELKAVLEEESNLEQAEKDISRAIALAPDRYWYWWTKGYFDLGRKNPGAALKDFRNGVRQTSDNIVGLAALENYFYVQDKHEQAVDEFTKMLAKDPRAAELYFARASTYVRLSGWNKALQDLNEALTLKPRFLDALLYRGYVYERLEKPKQAQVDYAAACKVKPTVIGWRGLASCYFEEQNYEKAAQALSNVIDIRMDLGALTARAACYEKLGKIDLAKKDRQKVVELKKAGYQLESFH